MTARRHSAMTTPDSASPAVAPAPTFPPLPRHRPLTAWLADPLAYAVPLLVLGGLGALGSWLLPAEPLGWLPGGKWISPHSGVCLVAAALALLIGRVPTRGRMVATRLLGLLMLGDGLLILLRIALGAWLPEMFASDAGIASAGWAGNASVMSALACVGVGLFFLNVRRSRYRLVALSGMLLVGAMGLVGLLGWSSGTYSQYFIADEAAVTSLPTAVSLLLLTAGLAAYGLSVGGWRWFLRQRPDRRLALMGGIVLFVVALASGIFGVSSSAGSVVALHEATLLAETHHLAEGFRGMVRDTAQELERLADAGERLALQRGAAEARVDTALENLFDTGDGQTAGLLWERAGRAPLRLGQPIPERLEFDIPWNDGASARLVWQDGLRLLLERPLPGAGRLLLVADLDTPFRRLLASYETGRSREFRLCAAGAVAGTALCLPSRLMPRLMTHDLAWQGQPLPMALALAGQDGTLLATDYRGVRVSAAHVPVSGELGLVAKIDTSEAMQPLRRQIWTDTLVILGLTLLGSLLFQRVAYAQVHTLMQARSGNRVLLDHVPAAVINVDAHGLIQDLNSRAEQMFGYPRRVALGMPAARLFVDRELQDERGGFRATWGGMQLLQARRRGGGIFDAEVGIARFALDGQRHAVLVVADVTARLRHERELERWELIFTHAEWGIAVSSGNDIELAMMNPHFARMHGYSVEELSGRPLAWVFAPAARAALGAHIALAHSRGHHSFESMHVRRDGSEFPVLVDVTTVRDESGAVRFRVVNVQDITERKGMEQALRDAESAQRGILDSQRELICRWRPDFTLEYVNRAFAAFFGRLPGELLGKNWLDLLPAETRNELAGRMADLVEHPRSFEYESQTRQAGGGCVWFSWSHTPLRSRDGQLTGFQGRAYDITARKEAELSMAENQRRLRALFDGHLQPTCLLALDGTVIQSNRAMLALVGGEREKLIGLAFWEGPWCRDLPETAARLQAAVARAAQGSAERLEASVRTELGRLATYEIVCSPVYDEAEGGTGMTMLMVEGRDVTAARRAEQMAVESEARLQAMASSLPGMVFEFRIERGELRPTHVSDGVGELCGLRADELVAGSQRLLDCVHADDRAGFESSLSRSAQLSSDWRWIGRLSSPNRKTAVWVNMRAKPRMAGKQVTWDGIALNITELKEKELEIADSRQALRDLSAHREAVREDERKYIAREIHDELGQNLTALRMGLAVLEAQGAMDPAAADIRGKVTHLKELVDKSIGVVRSVATSLRPAALDMGLNAALNWLADEFQGRSGIVCSLDLAGAPADLPDAMATGLFRIVQESLTNVARHAGARKVHVMLRQLGHHLVLEIRDDGKGFDTGAGGGRKGYGLMGIRERTLMLGGKINIVSIPEQGTVISVAVPLESA